MKKTCPAKIKCDKCMWWRPWNMTNTKTGECKQQMRCSIDIILEYIPQIIGSIDGCQKATNETRNYVVNFALGLVKNGILSPIKIPPRLPEDNLLIEKGKGKRKE